MLDFQVAVHSVGKVRLRKLKAPHHRQHSTPVFEFQRTALPVAAQTTFDNRCKLRFLFANFVLERSALPLQLKVRTRQTLKAALNVSTQTLSETDTSSPHALVTLGAEFAEQTKTANFELCLSPLPLPDCPQITPPQDHVSPADY